MRVRQHSKRLSITAVALALLASPAIANPVAPDALRAALSGVADQGILGFYRTRDDRPLWTLDGKVVPAAQELAGILRRAPLDGMADGGERATLVEAAVARAGSGEPGDVARAEVVLSQAWVDYVRMLRRPVEVGMVYAPGASSPAAPFAAHILGAAGGASDLARHLREVSELNPVYSRLRAGLYAWSSGGTVNGAAGKFSGVEAERKLRLNLDRARALPLPADGSFILVDASSARMTLYRNGQIQDSMRVVVGKASEKTPMIAGSIQNVVLNPYWNVPLDLVRKKASAVVKNGVASLAGKGFELLSDWSPAARQIDAKTIDWVSVASGAKEQRMRQLPGAGNAMGAMKFTFPNDSGIYLHDTPDKTIFAKTDRRLSSGCIRVEDARRLATWLFGHVPTPASKAPEQVVSLPKAMPVFVTYLTAEWDGKRMAFSDDGYARDASSARLASADQKAGAAGFNR